MRMIRPSSMKRVSRKLLFSAATIVGKAFTTTNAFAPFSQDVNIKLRMFDGANTRHRGDRSVRTGICSCAVASLPVGFLAPQRGTFQQINSSYKVNMLSSRSRNRNVSSSAIFSSIQQSPEEVEMTKDALLITKAAIDAVNPARAVQSHLSYTDKSGGAIKLLNRATGETLIYDVAKYDSIYIAAFGKAASSMGLSAAEILSKTNLPMKGKVITKDDHATNEQMNSLSSHNIELHYAGHPIPDERSIEYSRELLSQLKTLKANTLVINCISGGGSALFCTPTENLTLSHMSQFNQKLLASGMPITEMNVLRKKIEEGKGGGIIRAADPSTCITLVLSDVIGDPLDLIASGPSIEDKSTWSEAWELVQRYGLDKGGKYEIPSEILRLLKDGKEKEKFDTIEEGNSSGHNSAEQSSETVLVGNNALAVSAAAKEAFELGYNPVILGTTFEGEAADIANIYVDMAQQLQFQNTNPSLSQFPMTSLPSALIAGGETTVTLTENSGKGGRNQEIGLAAGLKMRSCNLRNIVLASVGTDGTDGPTDAAGAVVDGGTISRVEFDNRLVYSGEEALRNHDAYTFFDGSKQGRPLVKIGATGTNVADVCVTLIR